MVDRADAGAEREAGGDGAGDVLLRGLDGGRDVVAEGEPAGDGGGERAAGAVGVPVVQAGRAQHVLGRPVGQQVDGLAVQVAALDQHPSRPEGEDRVGPCAKVALGLDADAGELLDLGQVRRDDRGERDELRAQDLDGLGPQQRITVLADADRVDDQRCGHAAEPVRDGGDELGRGQHPGLDDVDADVVEDAVELRQHRFDRQVPGALDADAVLRGDGDDDAHAVDTGGEHRLEIGLDAGAAAGVRAGDGEHAPHDPVSRAKCSKPCEVGFQPMTRTPAPARTVPIRSTPSGNTAPAGTVASSAWSSPPVMT